MKKRSKFLLIFLLLLAVAGGVFYIGWIQIRLDEQEYGLVFTKLKGYDPTPVPAGEFHWRWEALIPTNLKLHVFDLSPRQSTVTLRGELPSGSFFSQFMEAQPSFAYEYTFRYSYRINPDYLLPLTESGELDSQDMDGWHKLFEDQCAAESLNFLSQKIPGAETEDFRLLDPAFLGGEVASNLKEKFPQVEFLAVLPVDYRIPDTELYHHARREYENLMETRRTLDAQNMAEASRRIMNEEANLGLLEKYGELFTKYPVLLEYLNLNTSLNDDILSSLELPE